MTQRGKSISDSKDTFFDFLNITTSSGGMLNFGKLKSTGDFRVYDSRIFNSGNQHMDFYKTSKYFKAAGNLADAYQIVESGTKIMNAKNTAEKNQATQGFIATSLIVGASRYYPCIAIGNSAAQIISRTELFQIEMRKAKDIKYRETHYVFPSTGEIKQWDGLYRNKFGRVTSK